MERLYYFEKVKKTMSLGTQPTCSLAIFSAFTRNLKNTTKKGNKHQLIYQWGTQ
jgi:hypothetical protein